MKAFLSNVVIVTTLCMWISTSSAATDSRSHDLKSVIQAVIDNYPSVESALLQVERARLSASKTQSQLGWQVNGQAGLARDVSLFGTGVDVLSASGQFSRKLASGGTIGVDASVNRQDSQDAFPTVPNPSTSTALDLTYRHPLEKGADNPAYEESVLQAKLDESLALAQRTALYDQLASQVIELYIGSLNTQIRQSNVQQAIKRSLRRQNYLKERTDLGVAEEKDLLQVKAQLLGQRAELKGLNVQWQTQRISLNRLMGRAATDELILGEASGDADIEHGNIEKVQQKAQAYSADLASIDNRLQLADSAIRLRKNEKQDLLDLVMFVGNRTQQGDTSVGDSSESEVVGGIRLEFQQQFDKNAVDAELDQALLDKDIALLDKKQLLEDIDFDVASLVAQLDAGNEAHSAYLSSVRSERAKLDEAEQRYRSGRSDTEQLLTFESQLAAAELASELQKLELIKNNYALHLLTGELWQDIELPVMESAR